MNNRVINYLKERLGKTVEFLTDIIMPKEKRVKLLEALGPDGLFEHIPRAENFDFETEKIKAIFNYRTVLCRQAIWEIKYRANRKLIRDFSLLLYDFILEELTDLQTFNNFQNIILLPIPASPARTREKGFNQCILICRELVKIDQERGSNNFTLLENFLIKERDTPHQARISNRKARLKNLIQAFRVDSKAWPDSENNPLRLTQTNHSGGFSAVRPLSDFSFIIIDDVITTAATMNEAFRALTSVGISPAKIRGFALAH